MLTRFICAICLFSLLTVGAAFADSKPSDKLNGTWTNDLMTVTIDVANGLYTGILLGAPVDNRFKVIKEEPEYVLLEMTNATTTYKVVVQFQSNGDILMTKEGGIPTILSPRK